VRVGEVATIRPLPDDSFEVPFAGQLEQIHSPPLDVIEITKAALDGGHDAAQGGLAVAEGLGTDVRTIHREQIEGEKERPLPPEQQVVEVAPAVWVQAADFPIEHAMSSMAPVHRPDEIRAPRHA